MASPPCTGTDVSTGGNAGAASVGPAVGEDVGAGVAGSVPGVDGDGVEVAGGGVGVGDTVGLGTDVGLAVGVGEAVGRGDIVGDAAGSSARPQAASTTRHDAIIATRRGTNMVGSSRGEGGGVVAR